MLQHWTDEKGGSINSNKFCIAFWNQNPKILMFLKW
jgi:hypothetical protein